MGDGIHLTHELPYETAENSSPQMMTRFPIYSTDPLEAQLVGSRARRRETWQEDSRRRRFFFSNRRRRLSANSSRPASARAVLSSSFCLSIACPAVPCHAVFCHGAPWRISLHTDQSVLPTIQAAAKVAAGVGQVDTGAAHETRRYPWAVPVAECSNWRECRRCIVLDVDAAQRPLSWAADGQFTAAEFWR